MNGGCQNLPSKWSILQPQAVKLNISGVMRTVFGRYAERLSAEPFSGIRLGPFGRLATLDRRWAHCTDWVRPRAFLVTAGIESTIRDVLYVALFVEKAVASPTVDSDLSSVTIASFGGFFDGTQKRGFGQLDA